MNTETYAVEGDGLTLSRIIWRRYRRQMPGLVEQALALNPGLAELGPFIPDGTVIEIPIAPPPSARQLPLVRLW